MSHITRFRSLTAPPPDYPTPNPSQGHNTHNTHIHIQKTHSHTYTCTHAHTNTRTRLGVHLLQRAQQRRNRVEHANLRLISRPHRTLGQAQLGQVQQLCHHLMHLSEQNPSGRVQGVRAKTRHRDRGGTGGRVVRARSSSSATTSCTCWSKPHSNPQCACLVGAVRGMLLWAGAVHARAQEQGQSPSVHALKPTHNSNPNPLSPPHAPPVPLLTHLKRVCCAQQRSVQQQGELLSLERVCL